MDLLFLLLGLIMLAGGADLLVRGGGQLALAMRIPALLVGLTIVSAGTSAPELLVSTTAAVKGSTEMALANVTGSNLVNIGLVLTASALVLPLVVDRRLMARDIPVLFGLQVLVPLLCLDGLLTRVDGSILLLAGLGYMGWLFYDAVRGRAGAIEDELEPSEGRPWYVHALLMVVGVGTLVVGANLFVSGAESVARALELSERFIGLTVVALGTSTPELATSMMGAFRGEADLAVGNVVGSNIFNIVFVLALTAIIQPIAIGDPGSTIDLVAAIAMTVVLIPIVLVGKLNRLPALLIAAGYCIYISADFIF